VAGHEIYSAVTTRGWDPATLKLEASMAGTQNDWDRGKGATMLSCAIQILDDAAVFRCSGRLIAGDADALRTAVLAHPPTRILVLDLAEISAVDAGGLGILVSLRKWATDTGTQLQLMNLTPRVESILKLTNLRSVFEVCSVQDMLELFRATESSLDWQWQGIFSCYWTLTVNPVGAGGAGFEPA
jgi:anti-anti-sigma factor